MSRHLHGQKLPMSQQNNIIKCLGYTYRLIKCYNFYSGIVRYFYIDFINDGLHSTYVDVYVINATLHKTCLVYIPLMLLCIQQLQGNPLECCFKFNICRAQILIAYLHEITQNITHDCCCSTQNIVVYTRNKLQSKVQLLNVALDTTFKKYYIS